MDAIEAITLASRELLEQLGLEERRISRQVSEGPSSISIEEPQIENNMADIREQEMRMENMSINDRHHKDNNEGTNYSILIH